MDWSDEVRARLVREEERLRYKAANLQARGKTVMAAQELVVAADIRAALERVEHVEGAMRADDKRLEDAAVKVWGEHRWGCDTPDQMADLILSLRQRVEECEREHPPEPEYTAWCEAGKPDVTALRQRVEECERAPRCCADTIPPGCRTCRCADAAEAKLARCVEALELLLLPIRPLLSDEPHERRIPTQHDVLVIRQARAALAATKGGE